MPSKQPPLLIIVHPGSACGSADMNLGNDTAEFLRLEMQGLVEGWAGGIAVIDGELSEELERHAGRSSWFNWGRAIDEALARATTRGFISTRIMGDDGSAYDQQSAASDLVSQLGLSPSTIEITLTGAWIEDDGSGCVYSVRDTLVELGFSPKVEGAMDMDFEMNEDELEDEEEDVVPSPPPRSLRPSR